MRRAALVVIGVLSIGTAWAQSGGSEIVIPPAPPLTPEAPSAPAPAQVPAQQPPPGLEQSAPPPLNGSSAVSPSAAMAPADAGSQPPPPDVAPSPPSNWVPGGTALVGVLNKVDGSTVRLHISVGAQPQTVGDLKVSIQACLNRPMVQLPDTAIFLTVTPTDQGGPPLYRGWMLRSAPGATFVGNAGETFRVVGCS